MPFNLEEIIEKVKSAPKNVKRIAAVAGIALILTIIFSVVLIMTNNNEDDIAENIDVKDDEIFEELEATDDTVLTLQIISVEPQGDGVVKVFDAAKSVTLTSAQTLSDEVLLELEPGDIIEYTHHKDDAPIVKDGTLLSVDKSND